MPTISDVVTSAYRKVGIGAEGETLTAEQMAEGVDAYNNMVFAWKLQNADTTHTALTSAGTFPLGNEYIEGTIYLLASRLSHNYSLPAFFDADAWMRDLQSGLATIPSLEADGSLLNMPSQTRHYD